MNFRQAMHTLLCVLLGSYEEPPGGEALYHHATQACNLVLGFP